MATASIAAPVLLSESTVGTRNSAERAVTPVNVRVLYEKTTTDVVKMA